MVKRILESLLAPVLLMLPMQAALGITQAELHAQEEAAIRAAVTSVADSVVRIETIGGLETVEGVTVATGPTTGVIVSEDGYIVSSSFSFIQQPTSILATWPDGTRTPCEIVGHDHSRMLVLLKASVERPLTVPTAVERSDIQLGQWAIAVGKTLSPNEPNISVGIISATNRIWGKAIQTDAKVSPNNYGGPLIDIHGRVLGILVPLSPQAGHRLAGAEWYDSGIGFAVPLTDILARLEAWKTSKELHAGLLGIALSGDNDYVDEAIVGVVRVNSPASKAGLQTGDKIVAAAGEPIARLGHLKHVMGRLYAGDTLQLDVQRGDQRLTLSAQLVDKLLPYSHPFLGVLPRRDSTEPGVLVRFVYPDSPAAIAGMREGDRIVALNGNDLADAAALITAISQFEPEQTVTVRAMRDGQPQELQVTLANLPEQVPSSLPPARAASTPEGERPATGIQAIKIAEEAAECSAYIPENYDPKIHYGLLVWLNTGVEMSQYVEQWRTICEQQDIILLVPNPTDALGWRATDVPFIRKTIDHVSGTYRIDPQRVVVAGQQLGGAMAYLTTFTNPDVVRGTVALDAGIPIRGELKENEPLRRLAVLTSVAAQSRLVTQVQESIERLRAQKFPVTQIDVEGQTTTIDESLRAVIARWLDSLDRI